MAWLALDRPVSAQTPDLTAGGSHGNSFRTERSTTVATPAANSTTVARSEREVTPGPA